MGIQDIIKKSVLEGFTTDIYTTKIIITLGISIILAVYIFFIYRLSSNSGFYSKDFNKTVACMAVITAAIVLAMQSSIVISLGMVGALSIVRFRNAIKNPIDLLFLFWSISVGIICGAGLYEVAVITCIVVTLANFLLDFISVPKSPYLLILNSNNKMIENELKPLLIQFTKSHKVKSRNITEHGIDLIIELKSESEVQLLEACSTLDDMISISLLSHDGETRF